MENTTMSWDKKPAALINELTQGRDLVKQLKTHLDPSASSSTAEFLMTKILSSFDKALLMVKNWDKSDEGVQSQLMKGSMAVMTASMSPHSVIGTGSPRSHDYNPDLNRENFKRRKRLLPRWTDKVPVCSETGFEGPPDDGYDWRKYGQKDILGAKYPRSYYRCSNRHVQGCVAIKQVQRTDEDPSMFSITYQGTHTCIQVSDLITPTEQSAKENHKKEQQNKQIRKSQEIVLNFQTGSEVKSKEFDTQEFTTSTSFSCLFPSTSSIGCLENENHIFSSLTLDNNFDMGSFSPPLLSPIASQSNIFSTSNSPILDLVFSLDPVDFQAHFLLDTPRIFN
ncbi:DNA-binding WRKY [Macleaya cordata]|uniref:DNA-binding WRKY n=1 Tax=Macleaya cordata TaxID=56857 RepID=A0A200RCJ2_MACCD|nr:DNA-binding WRKY [Macleaya cordata]